MKPQRNHIIGKAYDVTAESINKLVQELDQHHAYCNALEAYIESQWRLVNFRAEQRERIQAILDESPSEEIKR